MNTRLLRATRLLAVTAICVLGGYYAGQFVFSGTRSAGPVTPQMLTGAATSGTPESHAVAALPRNLPDIRLNGLDGRPRALAEWSDGPLLINFWATWCAPCLREMPMLESVWQQRRQQALTVVGIAVDRIEAVAPYVEQSGVTYPILVGESAAMAAAEAFGPDFAGLPYTVFAATGGRVVGVHSGELDANQVARILALVDEVSAGQVSLDEARARLR